MANTPMDVKQATPPTSPDAWHALRAEMDRLFDRFSPGFGFPAFRGLFDTRGGAETGFTLSTPAVDLSEDDQAYQLTAELPGMSEQDVEVTLSGDTLTIKGEKKQETEKKEKNTYLSERSYGMFQRRFTIPEGVDRDRIDAKFAKGVLTLVMPKTPAAIQEPKKIAVNATG